MYRHIEWRYFPVKRPLFLYDSLITCIATNSSLDLINVILCDFRRILPLPNMYKSVNVSWQALGWAVSSKTNRGYNASHHSCLERHGCAHRPDHTCLWCHQAFSTIRNLRVWFENSCLATTYNRVCQARVLTTVHCVELCCRASWSLHRICGDSRHARLSRGHKSGITLTESFRINRFYNNFPSLAKW